MSNTCNQCGRIIDKGIYCDMACQYEASRPHSIVGKWKEIQSICLGLAQLCEQPTTSVSDVIRGITKGKSCKFCFHIFDETSDYPNSPYCSIECRASDEDDMMEMDKD